MEQVIQKVKNSKRIPASLLFQAIFYVCIDEFKTCEEIADAINRTEKTLRNVPLPKMVKQGQLILQYPEQPNHPQQAYKAVDLPIAKIIEVIPHKDYTLDIRLSDGRHLKLDMSKFLDCPAYKQLAQMGFFLSVKHDSRMIYWDDMHDMHIDQIIDFSVVVRG